MPFSRGGGSRGSKPRKVKRVEVAGPYRSQSSVPSVRKQATKHEHRKVVVRKAPPAPTPVRDPLAVTPVAEATAQTQRKTARATRQTAKASKQNYRRVQRIIHHTPDAAITAAARGVPPTPALKKEHPAAFAKAQTEFVKHVARHENLKEPEDLVIAVTSAVPGGRGLTLAGKEAAELGGKAFAEKVGEQAAGKVESTIAKVTAPASGVKAATRIGRNVGRRVTGKEAIPAAEKAAPKFESKVAGTVPLKAAVGQTLPVVRGHEKAIVENPLKTTGTTARALPGFVTVPLGIAANVGLTGGRAVSEAAHEAGIPGARGYSGKEILAPVKYSGKAQLDFAKQVAKIVTSDDPKEVQKAVEDELGLILPLTSALGAKAVTDRIGAERIVTKVRGIAEKVRKNPHGESLGQPRVFEKSSERKAEANRAARAKTTTQIETADRSRNVARHAVKAKGKEELRTTEERRGIHKAKKLVIHTGDTVGFIVRHGIPLDKPAIALRRIHEIRDHLVDPDAPLPTNVLTTRDVTAYLLKHPHVLEDKHLHAAVAEARAQARYARETPALAHDHSEPARFSSTAVVDDVLHTNERYPEILRSVMDTPERIEKSATKSIGKEAGKDKAVAKAHRRKAATLDKQAEKARGELRVHEKSNKSKLDIRPGKAHEAARKIVQRIDKGEMPPEALPVGKELQVVGKGERGNPLPKRSEQLREKIDKLEVEAANHRRAALEREDIAKFKIAQARLYKHPQNIRARENEMVGEAKASIEQKGLVEPEYAHTGMNRGAPKEGSYQQAIPGKGHLKAGRAERTGAVQEGLASYIHDSIRTPVARRHIFRAMRDFLDQNKAPINKGKAISEEEARQLLDHPDSGFNRANWTFVPEAITKRAYDYIKAGPTPAKMPDDAWVHAALAEIEGDIHPVDRGAKGHLVRKAAAKEFFDQMQKVGSGWTHISKVNQAASYLILATSPAWGAMQMIAEYSQAALHHPKILNPLWVKKAIKAYHDMDPHKRQEFEGWIGVTKRNIEHGTDWETGLETGSNMAGADAAYTVFNRTPLGRLIRSIPQAIRHLDQWKGGRIRVLAAIAKMDKEVNAPLNGFLHGVRNISEEQARISHYLKDKTRTEQLNYWADHPHVAERYGKYLDEMLGNWTSLTKRERVASQMLIFYPFLRMSLRWTLYAFPKEHPIRAATSLWLGQQNAAKVKELLKGDPSFFSQYGMVPLYTDAGTPQLMDLSRIAPGSNALVEALGGKVEGPAGVAVARVAQPLLSTGLELGFGINPLTGKQEAHSAANAASAALSLSPLGRAAEKSLTQGRGRSRGEGQVELFGNTERQKALDKLFAKLKGSVAAQDTRSLGIPALPQDAGKLADTAHLGRILGTLEDASNEKDALKAQLYGGEITEESNAAKRSKLAGAIGKKIEAVEAVSDKAEEQLNGLFKKYGLAHEAEVEENRGNEAYGQGYYHEKKKPVGDGPPQIVPNGSGAGGGIVVVPNGQKKSPKRPRSTGDQLVTIP